MIVRWVTAFLDTPRSDRTRSSLDFWLQVTGAALSPRRGPDGEFATLLPPDGDAFLRWQEIGSDVPGVHLDLHVDDVSHTVQRVVDLGAAVEDERDGLVVLRSPGGFVFCVVAHSGEQVRPAPVVGAAGLSSLVDQVCLDIPQRGFDVEAGFWSELTGWARRPGALPEFDYLERPDGMPLRLLLQRLRTTEPGQPVSAHLDLACDDQRATAREHVRLGASALHQADRWTTLRDPAGRAYCVTSRSPSTGRLASA
jgi:hypothetical protein